MGVKRTMADDWVESYIKTLEQKEQQQKNAQKIADLAEAGASDAFQRIQERIRQDLDAFHKAYRFSSVRLTGDDSPVKFAVKIATPFAELCVDLDKVFIKYSLSILLKKKVEKKSGTLRISSDLNGVTQIYKNGDAFADDSEVSQFLLEPLLNHINSQ